MPSYRLAILGASPCGQCRGANCCRQNGHDYAVLLDGPDEWRRFAPFCQEVQVDAGTHLRTERVLPYVNGRCQFLGDADNRCTIYDDRPANCRRFECAPGFHERGSDVTSHSAFLRRNPDVLKLLEAL
jgi:Fe-S-cluster containining protein